MRSGAPIEFDFVAFSQHFKFPIGNSACIVPLSFFLSPSLLLLTIPRVRDFCRIRGLFEASTASKRRSAAAAARAQLNNQPRRCCACCAAQAEASGDDSDDDSEAEEVEDSERLGATTQRLRFRWWLPVLSAALFVTGMREL